jgi:hypothetical protein
MPIRNIPTDVIELVLNLAIAHHQCNNDSDSRRFYKKMLSTAVRHLEYFITPRVSVMAMQTALQHNVSNLSELPWRAPSSWALGKELMFEHAYPASDIVKKILSMESPSFHEVEEELKKAEIVWIHRTEDKLLKKNNRDDWKIEYARCGISLVEHK